MKLLEPFIIKDLTIKNRIVMAPMCMYVASTEGDVQPFHLVHYPTRGFGGVGLVITEATAVESRGRISSHDLGIWNDSHIEGLKKLVQSVHQSGALIGIQLAHAGRKCKAENETIIAPSSLGFSQDYQTPKEMSLEDIKVVINAFKNGARRAKFAGYDIIEIHGAHGYLINQFLSPLSNQRNDQYGGNAVNRRRFLSEVIEAVRSEWNGPLILRLSAEEYAINGNHIEDTIELVKSLNHQVDAINVSSGGVVPVKFDVYPGYQMEYAKRIKALGYIVIGGGLITTDVECEKYLDNGSVDAIFLGRKLLNDPYFVLHTAAKNNRKDLVIQPYERGF
jgi:NADPH2 dehydrogenase